MKPIVLIGANGSMGRRYQAILKELGRECLRFDIEGSDDGLLTFCRDDKVYFEAELQSVAEKAEECAGVIIASPTATHFEYTDLLWDIPVPILCEKPLSTKLDDVKAILDRPHPIAMMAQYALLDTPGTTGPTRYDFYDSGKDRLAWDCVTLIGLARDWVELKNQSPTWTCYLNGMRLTLDEVGWAYVDLVKQWLEQPEGALYWGDRAWLLHAHEKAAAWQP